MPGCGLEMGLRRRLLATRAAGMALLFPLLERVQMSRALGAKEDRSLKLLASHGEAMFAMLHESAHDRASRGEPPPSRAETSDWQLLVYELTSFLRHLDPQWYSLFWREVLFSSAGVEAPVRRKVLDSGVIA